MDPGTEILLNLGDFFETALMPPADERGIQPRFHYLLRQWFLRLRTAQNEDIGIIVFPARSSAVEIRDQGGTHARKLIGSDGHPNAACADQNSPLGGPLSDTQGNLPTEIGIINGFETLSSEIPHVHAAGTKKGHQVVLEFYSTMVTANGDHNWARCLAPTFTLGNL